MGIHKLNEISGVMTVDGKFCCHNCMDRCEDFSDKNLVFFTSRPGECLYFCDNRREKISIVE